MHQNSSSLLNGDNYTVHMRLWPLLACVLPLISAAALGAKPAAGDPETGTPAPPRPTTESDTENSGARLTLSLDDAPLLQVLHLLGETGPARFRLGAPPDAVVSVRWHDEDPFASLDELVRRAGWRLQRDGTDYFLLPLAGDPAAGAPPGAWAQWTKKEAPPRDALSGPDDSMKVRLAGKLAEPPAGGTTRKAAIPKTIAHDAALWRVLAPTVEARRSPGLAVRPGPVPNKAIGPDGATSSLWIRCEIPLAVVPHGARLLLESDTPCDVTVNGAPLARNWSGLRAFDVGPLLRRSLNIVAVRWNGMDGAIAKQAPPTTSAPMLRYEWIFDGGTAGAGLPGENGHERG